MTTHSSSTLREQTSLTETSRTLDANLELRARELLADKRLDPRTRNLIRYGLETNDKHLEQVVTRIESGETTIDHIHLE